MQQVSNYVSLFVYFPNSLNIPSLYLGNVYIADFDNHRIRKVTISTGIISTIAGTGTQSYSGDNGAATSATLNSPTDVALDAAGISYVNLRINIVRLTSLIPT